MSISADHFRHVLGQATTSVTVVTGADDDGPVGMAIGSFCSVSLEPPMVLFCPGKTSGTWLRMKTGDKFCVNILAQSQMELCGVMASKAEDKFDGVEWRTEATGAPVLPGVLGWIDCEIAHIYDGGDHDIVVGLVKALETDTSADPLLHFQGNYGTFAG
jgi:flavin reductase (DIM6/NTAB) family NADH-FMN oxidoreductase RutF